MKNLIEALGFVLVAYADWRIAVGLLLIVLAIGLRVEDWVAERKY